MPKYSGFGGLIGWPMEALSGTYANWSPSIAANWLAQRFIAPESKTLNEVRVYCRTAVGTPDMRLDIYSDNGSSGPNATLANTTTESGYTTGAWTDFTGLSLALTKGTPYWVVIQNVHGTPGSNYMALNYASSGIGPSLPSIATFNNEWGNCFATSTNSGSSWTIRESNGPFTCRLKFSDNSYFGEPIEDNNNETTDSVYSTREFGVIFTSPANAKLNVIGGAFQPEKDGTPTGDLRFRLYNNTTLLGTTQSIPVARVQTADRWVHAYFDSVVTIEANTANQRFVMSETTNSDSSSNRYYAMSQEWDSDSNSQNLKPFNGTLSKTYYNGSSWSNDTGRIIPFYLLLDDSAPFTATGSPSPSPSPAQPYGYFSSF